MQIEIINNILSNMSLDKDAVLVSIVQTQGSTPGKTGAQMLVGENGRLVGTIGGGKLELAATQQALICLHEKRNAIQHYNLLESGTDVLGMTCGGNADVWFSFIDSHGTVWKDVLETASKMYNVNEQAWIILDMKQQVPYLYSEETIKREDICLSKRRPFIQVDNNCCYIPITLKERAIIFGGGHIGVTLCHILSLVEFRVTLYDDRKEYASKQRFPDAEQVICAPYDAIRQHLTFDQSDYCIVLTAGHCYDLDVLQIVLRASFSYVGVVGSKRKITLAKSLLKEQGISDEIISRIHAPIGLAIGSVTPEEIAISIAAEMIQHRAIRR